MNELKLTLVQAKLSWENRDATIVHLSDQLQSIKAADTDIIVLPEMFTTGFTMHAEANAEDENGSGLAFMKKLAKEKECAVTGSLIIKENERFFNRLYWVLPDASYQTYDKRHLFRMADEHQVYTPGNSKLIVEYKGWKICPLICYDLRFPVWSRNTEGYDLLIYVANWPEKRNYAWKQLLIARAIENQAYVVGVNRVGEDGKGILYSGDSLVLDPMGMPMVELTKSEENTEIIALSKDRLEELRKSFPVSLDSDKFVIV